MKAYPAAVALLAILAWPNHAAPVHQIDAQACRINRGTVYRLNDGGTICWPYTRPSKGIIE